MTDTVDTEGNITSYYAEVSVCISRRARDILRTLKTRTKVDTFSELIDLLFVIYQDWSKATINIEKEKNQDNIKERLDEKLPSP